MTYIPAGSANPEYIDFFIQFYNNTDRTQFVGTHAQAFTSPAGVLNYTSSVNLPSNSRVVVNLSSLTGGGDTTFRGDTINQDTGVVTTGDTDTVAITSTGYWYTNKYFFGGLYDAVNPELSFGGTISNAIYLLEVVEPYVISNTSQVTITGYEFESAARTTIYDINLIIESIKYGAPNQLSINTLEDIETDGRYTKDRLRGGGNDRSNLTYGVKWLNNVSFSHRWQQPDFNTYFTSGENVLEAGDGICVYSYGYGHGGGSSGGGPSRLRLYLSW